MFGPSGKFRWFDEWNRRRPFDLVKTALPAAILGGGVFAVAVIVILGNPLEKETVQTGPRGTGMVKIDTPGRLMALEAVNILPPGDAPWPPEADAMLAGEAYENVQVLGHLTVDNFNRLMAGITEWVSPEQGCAYCHGEDDLASDDVYTKVVARRMIQMTWALNQDWEVHTAPSGVTCYICHRGENVPPYVWTRLPPVNETVGPTAAFQNRAMPLTGFTSLPANAIEAYLLDGELVAVNDQAPRVDNAGLPGMKETERTYALMMHFTQSLGANCTFCHNTRAVNDPTQLTPQWTTATLGISMVQDLNQSWVAPLAELLPEHRLGPLGDAPKVYCLTCHQGATKPLLGQSMLGDWPELISAEPVYD